MHEMRKEEAALDGGLGNTIGVHVDYSSEFGRNVFLGAAAYLRRYSSITLVRITELPKNQIEWRHFPEKLIAHIILSQSISLLQNHGVSVVNVSGFIESLPIPSVRIDDVAVGEMMARYFVRKCFRRFVFIGDMEHSYSRLREQGFAKELKASGHRFDGSYTWQGLVARIQSMNTDDLFPVAVACSNDRNALKLLSSCKQLGWQVPEQMAVVGVDNDPFIDEVADPPLSSVEVPGYKIGFEAARRLCNLEKTEGVHDLRIPPIKVHTRQSSDLLAVDDPVVAKVLDHMNKRFHEPVSVNDWLALVPLCRRALELRFRESTGRSMHQELIRIRIDHAKELLVTSSTSVERIAEASGFGSSRQLSAAFGQHVGTSPTQWRKSFAIMS